MNCLDPSLLSADPFDPTHWAEDDAEDVAYLHLSDRTDCYAILDRQDYEWARSFRSGLWCHTYGSGDMDPETGVMSRPDGIYARKTVDGKTLFLHRLICERANGPAPILCPIADHMNGHTLDCRRVNLRWVTRSQNAINRPKSKTREAFLRAIGRAY